MIKEIEKAIIMGSCSRRRPLSIMTTRNSSLGRTGYASARSCAVEVN